ncbi:hypothetical protein [Jiangella alkaliphila]|uniref:Uncharacterized protein n=1 Tax=Jiangella alkaliphila TaxID=419479 RepID=A0A1H2LS86_9ACTN|nr:hypothetical protein [Jiangella alkaliphila]SDU83176.1 hypothetical protein SAMN04488563_6506 [Jiangella alkaliphila]
MALTGDLPMNEGYVDVVVGLLAAPGEGLLDKATEFLGDLAELTRVPQLTAAAGVATKITAGVDKLLGTDETIGLLALQTSINADGLRDGYYVATNWPAANGGLDRLRVTDARLEVLHDDQVWRPAAGFDYFVLEVATTGSHPDRWRQLGAMPKVVKDALSQLAKAVSDDDVAAAGSAVRVAIVEVEFEPNLTVEDRAIAADRIAAAGVERRKVILTKQAGEASGDSDRAEILGKLQSIDLVGADVTKRLSLMRQRAFG